MELAFTNSLTLSPKLNQQQIQFLSLLKMCETELQEFMAKEMLENPMLDVSSSSAAQNIDFHNWYQSSSYALSSGGNAKKCSSYDSCAWLNLVKTDSLSSLQQIVFEQLDLTHCSKADITAVTYLIESLDERGFLPFTAKELARMSGISEEQLTFWMISLKQLEPIGIFSYDVADCLKIQLTENGCSDSLAYRIAADYFDLFMTGKTGQLAKKLHTNTASVRDACRILSGLSPYPHIPDTPSHTRYIIPDMIVKENHQKWEIILNDSWYEDYSLCDYYYQMMLSTSDEELLEYLKNKYRRAHAILDNIIRRKQTLITLTEKIVMRQDSFLKQSGPLKPMTMSEIAGEMNISVSTVSRAVNGKYIQTPAGIFQMKDFFKSGLTDSASHASVSSDAITKQMKALIQSEDVRAPLSDQQIAERISSENQIPISRRTIAKYRELAGIPSTRKRRLSKS